MTTGEIEWTPELMFGFMDFFLDFKPYSYQRRFLEKCLYYNRVAAKFPRQSGKSHSVAAYSVFKAINTKCTIIIVAPTQTQSGELYGKVRSMATSNAAISKLINKSTETEMTFKNGSRIISLPSGPDGKTIRGFTADIIIIEEAGFMKDLIVNTVITPMIASKGQKGQVIKIGTPWTRNHFYRSIYEDKTYKDSVVSIDWKEVLSEGQYNEDFINEQRIQLTDLEFRTEYGSEFLDDSMAFFPLAILNNCKENYPLFTRT